MEEIDIKIRRGKIESKRMEIEEARRGESGHVVCGSWIRRPKKVNWAIIARASKRRGSSSPPLLNIFSFDPITTSLSSSPLVFSFSFYHCCLSIQRASKFCRVLGENLGCCSFRFFCFLFQKQIAFSFWYLLGLTNEI